METPETFWGLSATAWSAIGAIGQCVGALATAAAVWIALRQIRQATTTKIEIRAEERFLEHTRVGDSTSFRTYSIRFTATNVGVRAVVIREVFLKAASTQTRYPIATDKMPAVLQESDFLEIDLNCDYVGGIISRETPSRLVSEADICFRDSRGHISRKRFSCDLKTGRIA